MKFRKGPEAKLMKKTIVYRGKKMDFGNTNGPSSFEELKKEIDTIINAYNALDEMWKATKYINPEHIESPEKHLKQILEKIETVKNEADKKLLDPGVPDAWKLDNDSKEIRFAIDLKEYAWQEIYKARNRLTCKEKVIEKPVEKPVEKSIDKNTVFTSIIAVFAIASGFLTNAFGKLGNFTAGYLCILIALLMLKYRKKFFDSL